MHARVLSGNVILDALPALKRTLEESILPCAREQPGFRGAVGLVDHSTGRGMLIIWWESAEALTASECEGALSRHLATVSRYLDGPAVRETYEIELAWPEGLAGEVIAGEVPRDVLTSEEPATGSLSA